jgi:hypothetical protein
MEKDPSDCHPGADRKQACFEADFAVHRRDTEPHQAAGEPILSVKDAAGQLFRKAAILKD